MNKSLDEIVGPLTLQELSEWEMCSVSDALLEEAMNRLQTDRNRRDLHRGGRPVVNRYPREIIERVSAENRELVLFALSRKAWRGDYHAFKVVKQWRSKRGSRKKLQELTARYRRAISKLLLAEVKH